MARSDGGVCLPAPGTFKIPHNVSSYDPTRFTSLADTNNLRLRKQGQEDPSTCQYLRGGTPIPTRQYSSTDVAVLEYRFCVINSGTGISAVTCHRHSTCPHTPPKNKEGNDIHRFPLHILKLYSNLLQRYNYATVVRDGRKFLNATLANNFNLVSADAHLNQFVSNSLCTLLRQSLVV